VQKSTGKGLASIFWDQDGILLVDYLPKGQTMNMDYYSSLLVQLKEKCRRTSPRVLFLHNSTLAHGALANHKKLAYLGFQCLDHPPYSPELVLSDYHLYPGLKKLKGRHFCPTCRSLLQQRPGWMDHILNLSGFQKLEQRARKCIVLRGEHVE
jgi:histone-lysine N-methyltransferase SETMAR